MGWREKVVMEDGENTRRESIRKSGGESPDNETHPEGNKSHGLSVIGRIQVEPV